MTGPGFLPRPAEEGQMRVQVEIVCSFYPQDAIKAALQGVGQKLTSQPESVLVRVDPTGRIAVLEFEMRRMAQHRAVDDIYRTVRDWAWAFYEDITIRFPK